MQNHSATPTGYMRNPRGHLVPMDQVKQIDKMRDDLVRMLCAQATALEESLTALKRHALADVDALVDISAEQYGARIGGRKGNVELISFDGDLKIIVQVRELIVLDERMQAARALIDEYLTEVLDGAGSDVVKLINAAFATDPAGKVSTAKVLALRRVDIQHPIWQRAMQALVDSMSSNGSCRYIRFYRRTGDSQQYEPIVLDIAQIST